MCDQNQKKGSEKITTPSEKEQEAVVGGFVIPSGHPWEADPSHFHDQLPNRQIKPVPPQILRK